MLTEDLQQRSARSIMNTYAGSHQSGSGKGCKVMMPRDREYWTFVAGIAV